MIHLLTLRYIPWYKRHDMIHETIHYIQLISDIIFTKLWFQLNFFHLYQHRKHLRKVKFLWTVCFCLWAHCVSEMTTNWNYACVCVTSQGIRDRKRSKDGAFLSLCYEGLGIGQGVNKNGNFWMLAKNISLFHDIGICCSNIDIFITWQKILLFTGSPVYRCSTIWDQVNCLKYSCLCFGGVCKERFDCTVTIACI